MNHRIRIIKKVGPWDGPRTEFSIEVTTEVGNLNLALEDAFGSLRSFNAEMAKQKECCEEEVKETGFGNDTACDPA